MKESQYIELELKPAEKQLIDEVRSIGHGEIELIKIQNGVPVYYKIRLQTELFDFN